MAKIKTTQADRAGFTSAIVNALENKKETPQSELKAMDLVQFLQNDRLTFEEMLVILDKSKQRIHQMIELSELDEKFKDNA